MTPGQRRAFWACGFAMAYIFFYEARGVSLVWHENAPQLGSSEAARRHFWEQIGWGSAFLFGIGLLTVLLRRSDGKSPYLLGDWIALAVALGVLAGTAYQSFAAVTGLAP